MFGSTPEDLENEVGECLTARTAGLATSRASGPPDLVESQKVTKGKVSSMYHFVTGVDVSSAAAIAAYLTTLTAPLGESQSWFSRAPQWRVIEGTYCSYNVFSKVDIRVTASFPGGTRMYLVTPEGSTEDVDPVSPSWSESYMSAMIRCSSLKDDDMYYMENTRHEFPFDAYGVKSFSATFAELYKSGYLVGAGPWVQTASSDCNYMVDASMVSLDTTGQYAAAIDMLGQIEAKEVMAQVSLKANQEVNAVSSLVNTAKKEPRNARILAMEAEFCLSKHKLDLALDCAKRAVAAKPSDFYPWEVSCKVYIAQEQWSEASLASNSTPLIPMNAMDVSRMPPSKKIHRPSPQDGILDEAWQFTSDKRNPAAAQLMAVSPTLARSPAAQLKGSTARAYHSSATINSHIGWNELMRSRGEVFWMEAESEAPIEAKNDAEDEDKDEKDEDKDEDKGDAKNEDKESSSPEDGSHESKDSKADTSNEKSDTSNEKSDTSNEKPGEVDSKPDASNENSDVSTSKPDETSDDVSTSKSDASTQHADHTKKHAITRRTSRSKRSCERRIDRSFLILYEDVRAYSTWQREVSHFESQQSPFDKSAMEWQVFGSVAQRSSHNDQAKRAYTRSSSMYFNHKASARELEYEPMNIDIIVKLMAWNHRWYNEFSPRLMSASRSVVARDGITKVKYEVEARFAKESVVDLVKISLDRLANLKVPGYDS